MAAVVVDRYRCSGGDETSNPTRRPLRESVGCLTLIRVLGSLVIHHMNSTHRRKGAVRSQP